MKKLVSTIGLLVILAAVALAQQQRRRDPSWDNDKPYDQAAMYRQHFTRVNDQFSTGGDLPLVELARLKQQGIKAIINLIVPSEHDAAGEVAEARRLDLRYYNPGHLHARQGQAGR